VTVYFGYFFQIKEIAYIDYWATYFHGKSYVFVLAKNGLGYILGDFFTNASGHPGKKQDCYLVREGLYS
jgi:hypothetical protein